MASRVLEEWFNKLYLGNVGDSLNSLRWRVGLISQYSFGEHTEPPRLLTQFVSRGQSQSSGG